MRSRFFGVLAALLCVGVAAASATTIPFTGSFTDAPQSEWAVNLSGPQFSVSTVYYTPFARAQGAPPPGQIGTLSLSVDMSDYESPADGVPTDSGSLDGVSGIVEGEIDFQVTYNPSPLGDPTAYAPTVAGIPVTFDGQIAAYTCSPAASGGCFPGTELWTASLTGSGLATVSQSSGGIVDSVDVAIVTGIADPPVPAGEPSALPFLALALGVILFVQWQRQRTAGKRAGDVLGSFHNGW